MRVVTACLILLGAAAAVGQSPADTTAATAPQRFWRDLDARFAEPLSAPLQQPWAGGVDLDSLVTAGDRELAALLAGERWRTRFLPLKGTDFNRCEGLRPAFEVTTRHLVRHGRRAEAGLGYGIASERFVWQARVWWPLAVATPRDAAGRPTARSWERLTLEVHGRDQVRGFAGEQDLTEQVETFFTGRDDFMHHGLRGGGAAIVWRPVSAVALRGGWRYEEQRPLQIATRWSLFGDRADVPVNWQADRCQSHVALAGGSLQWRRLALAADLERHHLDLADPAPPVPAGALWRLSCELTAGWISPQGHEAQLRAVWRRNDRAAPLQGKHWLGGAGTLRGYPVRELAGDDVALISLDLRGGFDPLRAARIPVLGKLGLQPLAFADWGRTTRAGGPLPPEGVEGWRADVGVGLGYLVGLPTPTSRLRLYAAKPVFNGQSGRDGQFVLQIEP